MILNATQRGQYIPQPLLWSTGWNVKERNDIFYLTTHSTHFIYGYMRSEGMRNSSMGSPRGNDPMTHHIRVVALPRSYILL